MKFCPEDEPLFLNLPEKLKKAYDKVSICPLNLWDFKMDQSWIAVAENLEPAQVVSEVQKKKINHLMQKNSERFDTDIFSVGQLAENPDDYFQSQYQAFSESSVGKLTIPFRSSKDKDEMKIKALEFVEKIKSPAVLQAAESILEELYMNAMIDAPREAAKFGNVVKSPSAEIFLAYSEKSLQISCSDLFGSLNVHHFLTRMNEVYEKGMGQAINLSVGSGAGIGCVILFENCTSLILGVRHRQITKVTCMVPLGIRSREREQMKKSLHWFEL